ncbi:MAG: hypothetical protein EHM81_01640 [Chloroflexi bacterium]|nr:MAG: hypothetical protein EHM81_01640 [Chloroflexota bacterium]
MLRLTFPLLIAILILSACLPAPGVGETPPDPPAVESTSIPTQTIAWFPATATWTPVPTFQPSATPQMLPGLGAQAFSDNFPDPQAWTQSKTESDGGNNVIVNRNRLTLSINAPPAFIFSTHKSLQLRNFYAEATARINRCLGNDSYGMLFRSQGDYYAYRFILNCKGEARAERMRGGEIMRLGDWVPSGDAPVGAPGEVKIGVWMSGAEMRLFLNGHYQFSAVDTLFNSGTLGFFANAANEGGMKISFTDLTVNDVSYVSPTPTATPSKTPRSSRVPTATLKP